MTLQFNMVSHRTGKPPGRQRYRHMKGYMLLEILITVGVLAVGLLGVAALQVTSLKTSQSAVQRGEAAIRIAEMTNRMRANSGDVETGNYNNSAYTSTKIANPASRADEDFNNWLDSITTTLGAGAAAKIACTGLADQCVLGIRWDDQRGNPDVNIDNAADTSELYVYESMVVF